MKAFVGHSFSEEDKEFIAKILKFLKSTGIKYQTAEKKHSIPINEKVREKIEANDIFIGIFTRNKKILVNDGENDTYTTSNWVIQESGYALGKDKNLILFVEEGIDSFPKLQSDLEYIEFNKGRIDEFFININNLVKDLEKRFKGSIANDKKSTIDDKTEIETPKSIEQAEEIEIEETDESSEKQIKESNEDKTIDDKSEEIFKRLWHAIHKDKDYNKARKIYSEEYKLVISNDKEPNARAFMLRNYHEIADPNAFEELKDLYQNNKDNPYVIFQLASTYKFMQEYSKAKHLFLSTTVLFDINNESIRIIDGYGESASCLSLSGKYGEATELLLEILNKDEFEEYKSNILAFLAEIARQNDDSNKFFIYAESALEYDPSNTDLRLRLAYEYSNENNNELSLLHYKKLINSKKSSAGLNNLGVQYNHFNLPGKSISSYLESSELNNTLSMANIAQKYLDSGFIKDAEIEIKKAHDLANEGKKIAGNVGVAQNRLDRMLDDENKKENKILKEAEKEREFRVKYSEAFYSNLDLSMQKFECDFETPWGILNLKYDENKNSFKIDQKMIESESGDWVCLNSDSEEREYRLINIMGKIEKFIGTYKIKVEDITEYSSPKVSPYIRKVHEADGYMIINANQDSIDVMEKNNDEVKYHCWKKRSDNQSPS